MRLTELFSAEDLIVRFEPTDKWDAIRRLVGHLVQRGRLAPGTEAMIVEAVLARERSMSTGMEHGIAIPHAAVEGVDNVVACMGVVSNAQGLAFDSIDGRPTRVIVLLIIPRAQKLLHIRTLADIARVLGRDSVRDALIAAKDAREAWSALTEGDTAKRA